MFDIDLTKFSFLNTNSIETIRRKSSSSLPRPRLSRKNVKRHIEEQEGLSPNAISDDQHQPPFRIEVEDASSSDSEQDNKDFDYDYASVSQYSECDSGHQSGCGSGMSIKLSIEENKQHKGKGLLAPSTSKSARFRSVSFNEDEDGYSYVSYNSGTPNGGGGDETANGNIGIVGSSQEIVGPFGPRKCVYLDQGRSVGGIEDFVYKNVLPFYSDSCSNSKLIEMREEARQIIKEKCGVSDDDEVIFCGVSGPIQTLINFLIKPEDPAPVVILGPFQSETNYSAWKKVAHEVIRINSEGERTLKFLKSKKVFKSRLVIGCFSVGSNVTGTLSDDLAITSLLHKYGGYAVWDYGSAGPHVETQMNPKTGDKGLDKLGRKDAVFLSGSKFLGGPQTPDVLIAKKSMFRNSGSLAEYRKTAALSGPNIIGEIRLGLVFQLHNSVGCQTITRQEAEFTRQILDAWAKTPEILLLGATHSPHLPIVSFMIKHSETGYFLHHEFVVTLLRDLFGIHSSTGSTTESSHVRELLGVDDKLAKKYDQQLSPGFNRIFLSHTATQKEVTFTIEAVKLVATQGWKLLPFYEIERTNGTFRFSGNMDLKDKSPNVSLRSFNINSVPRTLGVPVSNAAENYRYDECLIYARNLIDSIEMITQHNEITHQDDSSSVYNKSLRWFLTPSEALLCIKHPYNVKSHFNSKKGVKCPIVPMQVGYSKNQNMENWTRGSIPYNYSLVSRLNIDTNFIEQSLPPLPPRLAKSSSLQSLDVAVELAKSGGPFSRREFQSHLNHNYFGYP